MKFINKLLASLCPSALALPDVINIASQTLFTELIDLDLNFESNINAFAGIASYDLDTMERRYLSQLNGVDPAGDPRGVTCNDVVQTSDGTSTFVTDSFGDRIFRVSASGAVTLETAGALLKKNDPAKVFGINGIDINSQNELIIVQV
jgi:hypothetical protein